MPLLAATGPLHTSLVNQWFQSAGRPSSVSDLSDHLQDLSGALALTGLQEQMKETDGVVDIITSGDDNASALVHLGSEHIKEIGSCRSDVVAISGNLEAFSVLGLPRVENLYADNMATLWADIRRLAPRLQEQAGKPCLETDNARTLYRMANAEAGAAEHGNALANYVRAAENSQRVDDGPYPGQTTKLALALKAMGFAEEAENFLRWSTWQRPHPFVWTELGILWRTQERIALSIQALKQASRAAGTDSRPQAELGITYMQVKDWEAAVSSLSISVFLDGVADNFFPTTHLWLASALRHNEQQGTAEKVLKELIKQQKKYDQMRPQPYIELADLFMEQGDIPQARAVLLSAMKAGLHQGHQAALWSTIISQLSPDQLPEPDIVAPLREKLPEQHGTL